MVRQSLDGVLQHIRKLAAVQTDRELADHHLLERFVRAKDGAAFTVLVERHGPMVLGTCRRALHNEHDAEDACQATFLVLARDAASIRKTASLGSWLHGVASQVAANLKRERLRRCRRERQYQGPVSPDPVAQASWQEVHGALDEELRRLPECLRAPLVLCYLDGRTRDEAARQLGVSAGCLHGRLERARRALRDRLTRRGVTLSAALLATALGEGTSRAALAPMLVLSTVQAAVRLGPGHALEEGIMSTRVATLARKVVSSMSLIRLKIATALLLVAGAALGGVGVLTGLLPGVRPAVGESRAGPPAELTDAEEPEAAGPAGTDRYGDPLPPGALARMGTVRWRHGAEISSIAFAADGKTVASAAFFGGICLWDAATGKEVRRFAKSNGALCIALSPDRRALASGDRNNLIHLWDTATGKELRQLRGRDDIRALAFAPDGKTLASAGGTQHDLSVRLWDLASGRQLDELTGHTGPINSVAFAPDGKTLASASDDDTLRVWDVTQGKECACLRGHQGAVTSVAFSADGKTLASGSRDKTVRLWNAATGKELHQCEGHHGDVRAVAFTPDGKTVASGALASGRDGADGCVRLWDVATGKERDPLSGQDVRGVQSLAFSPDGTTLIGGGLDATLRLWDMASRKPVPGETGHPSWVSALAVSPDTKLLASAGVDPVIRLWEPASGKELRQLQGHQDPVLWLRFSPDGARLLSGSIDRTVRLWEVATGKQLAQVGPLPDWALDGAFSADGKHITAGARDGTVTLWETSTGKAVGQFAMNRGKVAALAASPDGDTVAAVGSDNVARLWDVASRKELSALDGHQAGVSKLAFTADGKRLASGAEDGSVCVWDATTGKEVGRLKSETPGSIRALALGPDGKSVAVTTLADTAAIHLGDVATGKETRRLKGHRGWVDALAFSGDGRILFSGSRDTTVLAWDLAGRKGGGEAVPVPPAGRVQPGPPAEPGDAPGIVAAPPAPGAGPPEIPHRIVKEPAYKSTPKYCLLVFGPEAKHRAWLALDGDTLYVDRACDGDLTQAGDSVPMPPFRQTSDPTFAEERDVTAGEIHDGRLTHTNLHITQLRLRPGFTPTTPEETWFKDAAAGIRDGLVYTVILGVLRCSPEGERLGRVRQIAGSDERGLLHFADRAAEAPVIYFDGPLRMGLLPGQVLVRGDKPGELQACVGTRGVGAGTFAALVYTTQPGLIPDGISPHAELEFPAKAAGGTPVRTAVALKGRC